MEENKIVYRILVTNIVLFIVVILAIQEETIGVIGGGLFVFAMSLAAIFRPRMTLLVLMGSKFVFDGFWFLHLPLPGDIGILHLALLPFLVILVFLRGRINQNLIFINLFLIYVFWTLLSTLFNYNELDGEIIVRQAGPLLGLLLGSKLIRSENDLQSIVLVVCLGTIIPAAIIVLQYFIFKIGGGEFLYAKIDPTIRGVRFSGLYYDPATSGLVSIVGTLTGFYIVTFGSISNWVKKLAFLAISLNIASALIGQTRSIISVLMILSLLMTIFTFRKSWILSVGMIILYFLFESNVSSVIQRSNYDAFSIFDISFYRLMTDYDSRTLLTGRVGIWQGIWDRYSSASVWQQMFGTGVAMPGSHSSYFYLLLLIGFLGMMCYVLVHILILWTFWVNKKNDWKISLIGICIVIGILGMGIATTVTTYTTYQWTLYVLLAGLLNIVRIRRPIFMWQGELTSGRVPNTYNLFLSPNS